MKRRYGWVAVAVAAVCGGCGASRGEGTSVQSTMVAHPMDRAAEEAPGMIRLENLTRVVPRIATLRAEPAEVTLRPGDVLSLDSVKVLAYDAQGALLGRLPVYDQHLGSSAAGLTGVRTVRATAPGEADLVLRTPLWEQHGTGGPAPVAHVRILVR